MNHQPSVAVTKTRNGEGVVAVRRLELGESIVEFSGPLLTREQLPRPYGRVPDHYIQIGANLYMGPSGGVDDLFNHSCDPNAGLRIKGTTVILITIRTIRPGSEVTWDYSTTMDEDEFELDCNCGAPTCRKRIRDFKHLPKGLRDRYNRLGIVPRYALESAL